jgi:exosortase
MPGVPWNEKRRTPGARRAAEGLLVSSASLWVLATVLVLAALYVDVVPGLVRQWAAEEDYTHGFLIVPLALYFVWERREALKALEPRPAVLGAVLLSLGLLMLVVGRVGAELFLQRFSLIVVIAGLTWLILGTRFLRELAFPIAFLVFMIPLPAIVMNAIAFPLQLFAAQTASFCMETAGIPVLREGNTIVLANTTPSGPRPCSGIRSLQALLCARAATATHAEGGLEALGARAACRYPSRSPQTRSAGRHRFLAHYIGPEAAQGFYHSFRRLDRIRRRFRPAARGGHRCFPRVRASQPAMEKPA